MAPVDSVLKAIGNTPLVKLRRVVAPSSGDVYVKLEYYNPTGSYKDRMALAMIEGAEARGDLVPGRTPPMSVVEFTGGSTGSSLAMICAVKGYRFTPVSSDAFSAEKLSTMRAFGAELTVLKSDGGKVTAELFPRMKAEAERIRQATGAFFTDQFNNHDALTGYMAIGGEILEQLGGKITVYCGGVGTGGMLTGVSKALRAANCPAKIVALEPDTSAVLTGGKAGAHRVEGIASGRVPPHMQNRSVYDEARAISEVGAREMSRRLAREEGIFSGTSTGINVLAAVQLAKELGPGSTVVTVAVDTGLKYLAGDLYTV